MSFLVLVGSSNAGIEPSQLIKAAAGKPVTWFNEMDKALGGFVCLSSLAATARLQANERVDLHFVGRIRLDRRQELCAKLERTRIEDLKSASDARLCLEAYARWGAGFIDQVHGDFAFAIYDNANRELLCARDRLGIRTLVWSRREGALWVAGSIQVLVDVCAYPSNETLDSSWIADFLAVGLSRDPTRSVFASIHRLAPAHTLQSCASDISLKRYWLLAVDRPLQLRSRAEYCDAFHAQLDLSVRDRLPRGSLGVLMSGGLDSTTLAAKAKELSGPELKIFARTWLAGGAEDPEVRASECAAEYLGVEQTLVDGDGLRLDPNWWEKPTHAAEPDLAIFAPSSFRDEVAAMRSQASNWFYGEGPDNALTFEWKMHLRWVRRQQGFADLLKLSLSYFATKSLKDWGQTLQTHLLRSTSQEDHLVSEPPWVRGHEGGPEEETFSMWRPEAHRNLTSSFWPLLFEDLDERHSTMGIQWLHPYMDVRVLEFLLATPPIPWARHKLLLRRAMKGRLPAETLRRAKVPLHRDVLAELLRENLPNMPLPGDAVAPYVDLDLLREDAGAGGDIYALIRAAILQHWLTTRHA